MHLNGKEKIGIQEILSLIPLCFDKEDVERITYFADLAGRVE